jgi:hypothetical protein
VLTPFIFALTLTVREKPSHGMYGKSLEEKNLLKNKTIHRVTFNEITKTAIKAAFEHPRRSGYATG